MGYANEIHKKYEDEVKWLTISFKKSLRTGQYLDGTPTVTECTGDLYFSNIKINDTELTLSVDTENEEVVSSGEAVQVLVASGDYTNSPYKIKATCSTDSVMTPAQTLINIAPLKVVRG